MSAGTPREIAPARPLRDWLSDPALLAVPRVVAPHLAVLGRVTLLSGREKVGKSTVAGQIVAELTHGGMILGAGPFPPTTTLWYALDEPVSDTVRRFVDREADPTRLILNDSPRTIGELRRALRTDLEAFPDVGLVVVDTLSKVLALSRIDPNDARQVEEPMSELVDDLHATGCASVLLYHTGKAGREYRGSTALGAVVDEILTLRRKAESEEDDFDHDTADDGRRLLVQNGRNLRGRVQLSCTAGRYTLLDDAHPPEDRILEALAEHGSAKSRTDLAKLARVNKAKGLEIIRQMIADGRLEEVGGRVMIGSGPGSGHARTGGQNRTPEPTAPPSGSGGSDGFPLVEPTRNRSPEPKAHPPRLAGSGGEGGGGERPEPTPHAERILATLGADWTDLDTLATAARTATADLLAALPALEGSGMIEATGAGTAHDPYRLRRTGRAAA